MRVPSATGLVFGALAFSGSTLSAPTPGSPNPSSPNPNALDSPRMADSPTMGSPLLSTRWIPASPAIRDGSGRRRSTPRNARRDNKKDDKKSKVGEVKAEGLGILPQPVKDAIGGLLNTVDGVVSGLPIVGGLLGHTVGDTGKSLLDALDVKDKDKKEKAAKVDKKKPAAPPMARSVAHMDARDEHLKGASHTVEGIPIVGDAIKGVVNTVDGVLESKPRTFPRRQLAPPAMQLPAPVNAVTGAAGGVASPLSSTLNSLAAALDNIPIAGPMAEDIVQKIANTASSVAPRDLPVSPPDFVDQALPAAPPSTPDPTAILEIIAQLTAAHLPTDALPIPAGAVDTVTHVPGSILGARALPVGDPTQLPGQVVGQAVAKLPDPVAGVAGGVATTALGMAPTPGNKSLGELAAGMVTSVPVSLPVPGSALRAIGVPLGVVSSATNNGMKTADGVVGQAQDTLSTATGTAPAPPVAPAAPTPPGFRRALTDIVNGTPLGDIANTLSGTVSGTPLGGLVNTVTGTVSSSPLGGVKDTVTGMASPAAGALNTITGAASGLPVAGALNTATGTVANSPVSGVMNTAKGIVGGLPVAGGLSNTVTETATGAVGGAPVIGEVLSGLFGGGAGHGSEER